MVPNWPTIVISPQFSRSFYQIRRGLGLFPPAFPWLPWFFLCRWPPALPFCSSARGAFFSDTLSRFRCRVYDNQIHSRHLPSWIAIIHLQLPKIKPTFPSVLVASQSVVNICFTFLCLVSLGFASEQSLLCTPFPSLTTSLALTFVPL